MRTLVPHRTGRSSNIFDGIDHLFDSFFTEPAQAGRNRVPAVDIREEDEAYLVQAELPGVPETDLNVSIDDNVLTISANADDQKEEKGAHAYLVRERRHASFTRSFVLPGDADHEQVSANFKDGLLSLRVPKNRASKARKISVKAG